MPKLILSPISEAENLTTLAGQINNNNAATISALEKTLSRDAQSPNSMESPLDMNSNRILNLPVPVSISEPLRKADILSIIYPGLPTDVNLPPAANLTAFIPMGNIAANNVQAAIEELDGEKAPVAVLQAGLGAVARETGNKVLDILHAKDFGVIADGITDTTLAVQYAMNEASLRGKRLIFDAGIHRVTAPLIMYPNCHIQGQGKASGQYLTTVTFFHLDHSGSGFINSDSASSRSLTYINTYRTQPVPGPGFVPNNYGYDIDIVGGQDITIQDCHLHNPSRGVRIIGKAPNIVCGRIHIRGLTGQPLIECMYMTHVLDCVYLDEVHFWPYWSGNINVINYTRNNAIGINLGRFDNGKWGRVFMFGYFRALSIFQQGVLSSLQTGTVSLLAIDAFGGDSSGIGLLFNPGTNGARVMINNFYAGSDPTYGITSEPVIWFLGDNNELYIGHCHAYFANGSVITMNGVGNRCIIKSYTSYVVTTTVEFNITNQNFLTLISSPVSQTTDRYSNTGSISTPEWRVFTPVISAQTGVITTLGTVSGKYRRVENTIDFQIDATITTNGTGAGSIFITLPFAGLAGRWFSFQGKNVTNNVSLNGHITPGNSTSIVHTATGTYPGANATQLVMQGRYEI